MSLEVILVDDERHILNGCQQALELAGLDVSAYSSAENALENMRYHTIGVIVSDIKMPQMSGLDFMNKVFEIKPGIPVILMTGHGDIPMAVHAIKAGAFDFIEKPFSSERLVTSVQKALALQNSFSGNEKTDSSEQQGLAERVIGQTKQIHNLRSDILRFGATDADVLIFGETGAGKELVARSLHDSSPRREEKFVAINCGALPENIIESELFGHEVGAFTGAVKQRIGKFEYANCGTIFLDEIESMPMDLQVKLLRVLQERMIERLGSNKLLPIDIRIIAATKKDLRDLSTQGLFREDLYYRLNILSIKLPALRDRKEDIPHLFDYFLKQSALRYRCIPPLVTAVDLNRLMLHDWPGNVRELQNTALRYSLGLGLDLQNQNPPSSEDIDLNVTLPERILEIEKHFILQELKKQGGNLKATYEALGVSRKTLYDKMKKFGLVKHDAEEDI